MSALPEPLNEHHRIEPFRSREPELNNWLHDRARRSDAANTARTYVATAAEGLVIGYYTLSGYSAGCRRAPSRLGRNQPDPIPGVLIGRLAVDERFEGIGLGKALLRDALTRVSAAAETVATRAVFVDALNEDAARFWKGHGFLPLRDEPLALYMRLDDVRATIAAL
ncbi:GNAT family N-acetyltransferase [Humibacter albus]|uniref:GNAT family N-acetyltransferase n=1 Tax=Humibacter albus TaxID=427754 RepID=UPI0003B43ED0|nr:GNAT family N-acetyltransferase [Humibacter albus]